MSQPDSVILLTISEDSFGDLVNTVNQVIINTNQIYSDVGNVSSLQTDASNLTNALNEVYADLGDVDELQSFASANVVWALNELRSQIRSQISAKTYRRSFVNSDLSAEGILTVNHNLGEQYVIVQVWDGDNKLIGPDEIVVDSSTQCSVNLSTFAPISGTWHVVVNT